jgi:hypothetical protein
MKSKTLLSLGAAAALSGCVAPGGTNIEHQINVIGYPVHAAVPLMPLEMTPEEVAHYNYLRWLEAERKKEMLNGRVDNVQGW